MNFFPTLLGSLPYLSWPTPGGWLVWASLLGFLIWLLWRARAENGSDAARRVARGLALSGLLALAALGSLFVIVRLPAGAALPMPGLPSEAPAVTLLPFSAAPWALAAGMLGPLPGALIGLLSGLLRGLWDTHSLFTALEIALLAALFGLAVRQRYRTPVFRLLRQPLIAALILAPLHSLIYILGTVFTASGGVTARIDYALSSLNASTLAALGELLIAGVIGQILALAFPAAWNRRTPTRPSPAERSLETRALIGVSAFILAILVTLLVGDWIVAGNAARGMLRDRMASATGAAADSLPFFFETGQTFSTRLAADPRLASDEPLAPILAELMRSGAFFDELLIVNASGAALGGYPSQAPEAVRLYPAETAGVAVALAGVPSQAYAIPPAAGGNAARVSFLAALPGGGRVLIARADLSTNPIAQTAVNSLNGLSALDGSGFLLDEEGRIAYGPNPELLMQTYPGAVGPEPAFFDETASNGTRLLVYTRPVTGQPWSVVLSVPARRAQQIAVDIAAPLAGIVLLLAIVALVSLRVALRVLSGSLRTLAGQAQRIQQGQLDHPIASAGVDELGQLRRSFEGMRVALRDRLEELNRLLTASLGASSSLKLQSAVQPVLEAALATGASAARIALAPGAIPAAPVAAPTRFSFGPAAETYAGLDESILALAQAQERVMMPSMARARGLDLAAEGPRPGALLAVPLRHENRYYGALWVAYDQPHSFTEADLRFLSTLAGQASLAIANALLFQRVEIARQQLEAILASTPDPVLVTDRQNRLLLANPAAGQVLGTSMAQNAGRPIETVIAHPGLLALFQSPSSEKASAEIELAGGRIYLATASAVVSEEREVGRVCVLRDVTHFKELDSMKSEFVATVSHDLRSPLTLMRGYATMLEMVGTLNEQQKGYVAKITLGVENMSRLVGNLLDLGRIEIGVGLQVEPTQVGEILERVMGALAPQAAGKEIALTCEPAPDLARVIQADSALLHQAVYNLVENAIKYTQAGGRVILRARNAGDSLLFSVQDNGLGIPAEDLPHLFEKFYRGKQREARSQPGTGLGLAIVRSIAERHGGRVWAESVEGRGSIFFLQVPAAQPRGGK